MINKYKILIFFLFLGTCLLGLIYFKNKQSKIKPILDPGGNWVLPTITPTPTPRTVFSVTLLGEGGEGHEGGVLTDTIIIASADTVNKKLTLVNIPRDLWINVKDKKTDKFEDTKINFVLYKGGGLELKRILKDITDLEIDGFVEVDFAGFVKLVDLLGGLDVNVPIDFVDELYPIAGKETERCDKSDEEIKLIVATMSGTLVDQQFPCRYEKIEFKKGLVTMDGATTLKFVRSRHAKIGGGDFARAARQQAVIEAARKKIVSVWTIPKLPELITTTLSMVRTDITKGTIVDFLKKFPDIYNYKINRVVLSTDNVLMESKSVDRQYILVPKSDEKNWNLIKDFIRDKNL